jgi:trk system potassium uptake protein
VYPLAARIRTRHAWTDRGHNAPRRRRSLWHRLTPPQLFVGSFAGMILLGTLGLMFLPGLYVNERLGWVDALFTATSAVCVTGLIVVDTATHFTVRGQAFILLLIQLGGLGMITFTTLIILALGGRLSLRHEELAGPGVPVSDEIDHRRLTFNVVRATLVLEALGALVLYVLWAPRLGWGGAAWHAVFQSISAFCNAGFSTFSDSVIGFQQAPGTLLTMALLIILGGLGFLVLEEVYLRRSWRPGRSGARSRLSLHSTLVLATTAALLVLGSAAYLVFEWGGVLGDMRFAERMANAFFMSTTARTAGFNSVDYALANPDTNFLTILLMSIGGAPGSTAGGLKVTTFALIVLLAYARLRGWSVVSVWGRSVPEETVQRAIGLFVLGFAVVTLGIFAYARTELDQAAPEFFSHMFEAISAFNTVGLSLGVTPDLSTQGRWLTVILMFVGRVGPLAVAAALARRVSRTASLRYSREDVVIG